MSAPNNTLLARIARPPSGSDARRCVYRTLLLGTLAAFSAFLLARLLLADGSQQAQSPQLQRRISSPPQLQQHANTVLASPHSNPQKLHGPQAIITQWDPEAPMQSLAQLGNSLTNYNQADCADLYALLHEPISRKGLAGYVPLVEALFREWARRAPVASIATILETQHFLGESYLHILAPVVAAQAPDELQRTLGAIKARNRRKLFQAIEAGGRAIPPMERQAVMRIAVEAFGYNPQHAEDGKLQLALNGATSSPAMSEALLSSAAEDTERSIIRDGICNTITPRSFSSIDEYMRFAGRTGLLEDETLRMATLRRAGAYVSQGSKVDVTWLNALRPGDLEVFAKVAGAAMWRNSELIQYTHNLTPTARSHTLQALARIEPDAAVQLARTINTDPETLSAVVQVAVDNPRTTQVDLQLLHDHAPERLAEFGHEFAAQYLDGSITGVLAHRNADIIATAIASNPTEQTLEKAQPILEGLDAEEFSTFITQAAANDYDIVSKWLDSSGKATQDARLDAIEGLLRGKPLEGLAELIATSEAVPEIWREGRLSGVAMEAIRKLASTQPSAAMELVARIPDTATRDGMVRTVADAWSYDNPAAAAQRILALPPSKGADQALAALAFSQRHDPEAVIKLTAAIRDDAIREEVIAKIAEHH